MIRRRRFPSRLKFLRIASLLGIGMLAACGKPDEKTVPPALVQSTTKPCPIIHFYVAGLSKKDQELFSASAAGDVARAEQAIVEGANVNVVGSLKRTPLFAAAFCDRPEVAKLLIDRGSQANAKDVNGISPLHAAVIVGAGDTAKALIDKGADINIQDAAGRTPLHVAAATNQISLVELLLERKANASARDRNGITAASLASESGHSKPGTVIRKWHEKPKSPR